MTTDMFYVASQTKGIWVTTDNGKTFTQLATKSTGLASDTVMSLAVYSGDPMHQTLLAAEIRGQFVANFLNNPTKSNRS